MVIPEYDHIIPGNGYIEGDELNGFLKEFVSSVNPDPSEAPEVGYQQTFMIITLYILRFLRKG